jgi:hypothetical protein
MDDGGDLGRPSDQKDIRKERGIHPCSDWLVLLVVIVLNNTDNLEVVQTYRWNLKG